MTEWQQDKRWSDRFLPQIKQILGLYLIGEPPVEEDQERNTDLIVLRMEPVRIACRIRQYKYFARWPHDITIRAGRPSGAKTELTKIIEGWGQYLFYGFSTEDEYDLVSWKIVDLSEFRLWCWRYMAQNEGRIPGIKKENHDKSSWFQAFDTRNAPTGVVFAAKVLAPACLTVYTDYWEDDMLTDEQVAGYADKTRAFLDTQRGRDTEEIAGYVYPDDELAQQVAIVQCATGLRAYVKIRAVVDAMRCQEEAE
jgi:hypothetical protein